MKRERKEREREREREREKRERCCAIFDELTLFLRFHCRADETVIRHAVIRVPSEGSCGVAKINARPGKYDVFKALACRGTEGGHRPESGGVIERGTMAMEDSLRAANDLLGGSVTIKNVSQLTPEEAQSPLVRCS